MVGNKLIKDSDIGYHVPSARILEQREISVCLDFLKNLYTQGEIQ
jgi:hypothetical protein